MRDEGWGEFTNLTPILDIMDLKEFGQAFEFFSHLKIFELPMSNFWQPTKKALSSLFHFQRYLCHSNCMSKGDLGARREATASSYQYLLMYHAVNGPQSPHSSSSCISIILVSNSFIKVCRCLPICWCIHHFFVNSLHSLEIKQLTANWRKTHRGIGPMCALFYH